MKTKHKEIIDYWSAIEDECDLGIDWAEAHERCWRCGYETELQRCHIVPQAMNGSDSPQNLVLLCSRCHREAPNHTEPKYMWIWLKATGVQLYDTYWTQRGFEEFEKMFKRKPFSDLDIDETDINESAELLKKEMCRTTIHFGEGRLNPSTIACVIAEVEERLRQKHKCKL